MQINLLLLSYIKLKIILFDYLCLLISINSLSESLKDELEEAFKQKKVKNVLHHLNNWISYTPLGENIVW